MILRLLTYTLRPSDQKLESDSGAFLTVCYKKLLYMLAEYYRRYAAMDTCYIGKDLSVVHSVRDMEFENELKRIGVSCKLHLSNAPAGTQENHGKPRKFRPFYNYFRFFDDFVVTGLKKDIIIDRTNGLRISGPKDIQAKIGSNDDVFISSSVRISFPAENKIKTDSPARNGSLFQGETAIVSLDSKPAKVAEVDRKPEKKGNTRMFGKDEIPDSPPRPASPAPDPQPDKTTTIVKRGIEIDEDF